MRSLSGKAEYGNFPLTDREQGGAASPLELHEERSTRPLTADAELANLALNIKEFYVIARAGTKAEEDGRAAWRNGTMKLYGALLVGRELHQNDNNAFRTWLRDIGLGDDFLSAKDRWALLNMAEHPEVAERVLATTQRRSWRLIWEEEVRPAIVKGGVSTAGKTPATPKPNRGGRRHGRTAPVQSADPIADVARELIAKCSGPKSEWRSLAKTASIVQRAEPSVRDALSRLGAKTTRGADGQHEYRIDGERKELLVRVERDEFQWASLVAQRDAEIADLRAQLAAANEKIRELEAEFLGGSSLKRVLQ
jgi:hypothetical protein